MNRRAREERRQVDFKEAARQKNDLCEGSAWGNWDPQESQQLF